MNKSVTPPNQSIALPGGNMDTWFNDFINDLKVDHFLLETDTASQEKKDLYHALMVKDDMKIYSDLRSVSSMYFMKQVLFEYMEELKTTTPDLRKLAFGISDRKVLVWCEINDNDDHTENALLLAEAKVNSKFHSKGIFISSMIIESSDKLNIPPHYQTVIK